MVFARAAAPTGRPQAALRTASSSLTPAQRRDGLVSELRGGQRYAWVRGRALTPASSALSSCYGKIPDVWCVAPASTRRDADRPPQVGCAEAHPRSRAAGHRRRRDLPDGQHRRRRHRPSPQGWLHPSVEARPLMARVADTLARCGGIADDPASSGAPVGLISCLQHNRTFDWRRLHRPRSEFPADAFAGVSRSTCVPSHCRSPAEPSATPFLQPHRWRRARTLVLHPSPQPPEAQQNLSPTRVRVRFSWPLPHRGRSDLPADSERKCLELSVHNCSLDGRRERAGLRCVAGRIHLPVADHPAEAVQDSDDGHPPGLCVLPRIRLLLGFVLSARLLPRHGRVRHGSRDRVRA